MLAGTSMPAMHPIDLFRTVAGDPKCNYARRDSGDEMWTMYMEEFKDEDTILVNGWKSGANGTIVFASLFSAIVAAFIIESYKTLSPDTGGQTVVLLGQISQQLADFRDGAYPKPPADQPFSPSGSMICINAVWLMSLVLSITSALLSTLSQGWADNFDRLPRLAKSPHHRARIRSFLSLGQSKYRAGLTIVITPTLLHISVLLFFIGLVIFFAKIHKVLAIIVLTGVVLLGLVFFAVSILPFIDPGSPYITSTTAMLYYLLSASLSTPAICLRWAEKRLTANLASRDDLGEVRSSIRHKLAGWLTSWYSAIEALQSLLDFPPWKLLQKAREESVDVDREALTRLFSFISLSESKISKLVASIPKDKIIELMTPPFEFGKIVFGEPLLTVLRCYAYDTPVDQLDEGMRKRSILVCLHAVHHIAKAFIVPSGLPVHELPEHFFDMVTYFAEIRLMHKLWVDQDPTVCVTSRSICALLVRQLVRGWQWPYSELNWLHNVIGEPLEVILESRHDIPALDSMNLKSFVFSVLKGQGELLAEQATCFTETLAILMDAGSKRPFNMTIFQRRLSILVESIEHDDREGRDEVVGKLQEMFNWAVARPYELGPGLDPDLNPIWS